MWMKQIRVTCRYNRYLNLTCFRIIPNKIYFIFRLFFFFFSYRTLFVIRKVIERLPYIIYSNLYRYKVYNSFLSFWFIWTLLGQFWVKWWESYIFKNIWIWNIMTLFALTTLFSSLVGEIIDRLNSRIFDFWPQRSRFEFELLGLKVANDFESEIPTQIGPPPTHFQYCDKNRI